MTKRNHGPVACVVDGHYGIYVPHRWAQRWGTEVENLDADTLDVLLAGPEHEDYLDAWTEVLDSARITAGRDTWFFSQGESGDVFLVHDSCEWCDTCEWVEAPHAH